MDEDWIDDRPDGYAHKPQVSVPPFPLPIDVDYLRQRASVERAAAEDAACMARTAHEDLADSYDERADALQQDDAAAASEQGLLLKRLDQSK